MTFGADPEVEGDGRESALYAPGIGLVPLALELGPGRKRLRRALCRHATLGTGAQAGADA